MELTETLLATVVNVLATSAVVVLALARWMQGRFDRLDDRLERLARDLYAHSHGQGTNTPAGRG